VTLKKLEEHLHRIHFHYRKLSHALYLARQEKVIEFSSFKEESPDSALWEVRERVDRCSAKVIAKTFQEAVKEKVKI
jgi:hypothetical protein